MKLIVLSSLIGASCAFAPLAAHNRGATSALRESDGAGEDMPGGMFFAAAKKNAVVADRVEGNTVVADRAEEKVDTVVLPKAVVVPLINGWAPDESRPCYGLPGAVAPTGFFDPIGFSRTGTTLGDVKRYREAEVMHGRVAMLATVGYLAGEAVSGPFDMAGPANDQLQQMPAPAFAVLTLSIMAAELKRASIGWVEPDLGTWTTLFTLRDGYYPGDLGFDPLGLKPTDGKKFASMQTKELQNGRLAMLGVFGMVSQELINHKTIFETIDFYQKVYSGINPYEVA